MLVKSDFECLLLSKLCSKLVLEKLYSFYNRICRKFTIESIMTDSGLNGDGNNQIDGGDGFDF